MSRKQGKIRRANVAVLLRLTSTPHRNRLIGIFNRISPSDDWNLRLLTTEAELRDILGGTGWKADGVISFMPREKKTRELIVRSEIPHVGIGIDDDLSRRRSRHIAFVCNDNATVARLAADAFARLGRFASFAFIPDRNDRPWSRLRGQAFAAELSARGDTCRFYENESDLDADLAKLGRFLQALPKPAAILAAHDARAIDLLRAARDAKVAVPEQVSVIGVDDDELLCEHATPTLSSVRVDAEAMGSAAADCLMNLMFGRTARRPVTVKIPPLGLIERASTKPVAPAARLIERAQRLIRDGAHQHLTPDDLAKRLGVSRRLLDLRFRQYAKMTVNDAIGRMRLAEAKRLLRQGKLPIKKVFAIAGFNNVSYAHRLFKKETGLSALAYRKGDAPARASHLPNSRS